MAVFLLAVTEELLAWPEQEVRFRRWFSLTEAAARVRERELRALIRRVPELVGPRL